jgi:hypothetical protein
VTNCATLDIDHGYFVSDPNAALTGIGLSGVSDCTIRTTDVMNFSYRGVNCGTSYPDLGTASDHGLNQICSDSLGEYGKLVRRAETKGVGWVDAEYNWWGTDSPGDSLFEGRIDYDPWLDYAPRPPNQQKVVSSQQLPQVFYLSQNHPNPFNPNTRLDFTIGGNGSPIRTRLIVYNILGQLVTTLVDEYKTVGSYTVYWDGRSDNGRQVSSGIYFCRLEAGDYADTKKMVLLR